MKWNKLPADITATHINEIDTNCLFTDRTNFLEQTKNNPIIVITEKACDKIKQHLASKNVELGGLLIGSVISDKDLNNDICAIIVKDAVASEDCDSTSVSLTMQPSVWQAANKLTDAKTFVVGWFHSHPNLGAFFSGTDRKTQGNFFNSAYSLGLVSDPIRNEEKWFIGKDSIEVKVDKIRRTSCGLDPYKNSRPIKGANVNPPKRGTFFSWPFSFIRRFFSKQ